MAAKQAKEWNEAKYCAQWLKHNSLSKYETGLIVQGINDINILCSLTKFQLQQRLQFSTAHTNVLTSLIGQISNLFTYIQNNSNTAFAQMYTPLLCAFGFDNIVALSGIQWDSTDLKKYITCDTLCNISYKINVTLSPLDYPPYSIADMYYNIFNRQELGQIPPHMHLQSALRKIARETAPVMQITPPHMQSTPIIQQTWLKLWHLDCIILEHYILHCNIGITSIPDEIINIIHLYWTKTGSVYPTFLSRMRFEKENISSESRINDWQIQLICVNNLQAGVSCKYGLQIFCSHK